MLAKKFFIGVMIMNLFFVTAKAEQPAANTYREIFASGNFFVEFKDKWGKRLLGAKNNVRMERMRYNFDSGSTVWFNPLAALFQCEEKNPEVLYRDGKFYHFVEAKKARRKKPMFVMKKICVRKILIRDKVGMLSHKKLPCRMSLQFFAGKINFA